MTDIQVLRVVRHEEGLLGKAVTLRFLEARGARKKSLAALKAQREARSLFKELTEKILNHDLEGVRNCANRILFVAKHGFQEVYDVVFEEFLLLKEKLLSDLIFLRNHGKDLKVEELNEYSKFLNNTKDFISETLRKYIKELEAEINEKDPEEGGTKLIRALNIEAEKYKLSNALVPSFMQWLDIRGDAKATWKIEARLKGHETKNKTNSSDIHRIISESKQFSQRFEEFMKKLFVFNLILIQYLNKSSNEIVTASSNKRWDLPQSYEGYGTSYAKLLDSEFDAIRSISQARLQLESLLKKVEERIGIARKESEQNERELKKAD